MAENSKKITGKKDVQDLIAFSYQSWEEMNELWTGQHLESIVKPQSTVLTIWIISVHKIRDLNTYTHTQHIWKMWFFFLLMYLKQDDKSKALQSSDMWNLNQFTCHSWEIKGLENGTITLQCSQRKPVCQVPVQKRIWAESSGGSAEECKLFLCSRTSSPSVYRIFVKHWGVSRFDLF